MAQSPTAVRPWPVAVLAGALLAAGCQSAPADDPVQPQRASWQSVSIPGRADGAARPAVRDLTWCAGHWYAVGADISAAGETSPAAWHSRDGVDWQRIATAPRSHYGRLNILDAAACRDGRLAAVGAMAGGAHGNPRTSSWWQRPDGTLAEVAAGFELYGGPAAVSVGRIAAGPAGWLIVGNRISGAAVWISTDAAGFEIIEAEPALASDEQGRTWAYDAVADADADGWLAAGTLTRPGRIDRDPVLWRSSDGRTWRRIPLAAGPDNEETQRLALAGSVPIAVGVRGDVFGAWRGDDVGRGGRDDADHWPATGTFGSTVGTGVPLVRSLAASGDLVVAVTTTGAEHQLWCSTDMTRSWRRLAAPASLPAGADRAAVVAAGDGQVLLLADDGTGVRGWRWVAE
ncbi:hypothetical protein ACN27F_00430 [Solwaraspora sp. WMMB335]|uniref:hypothetical protein n=1 Tax=Solwaraspora sp. WMMB335 TaxID=3404118 RepID=UPI003B95F7E5